MKLIIDTREPKNFIDIVNKYMQTSYNENMIVQNLDVGDIGIYDKDDNLLILFERKSLDDLIASIKDGRYNEQSYRLNKLDTHNHYIYYIIEGNIDEWCNKQKRHKTKEIIDKQRKTINSAIFTLSYYKGFSLIRTNNCFETGETIYRFYDKLMREKKKEGFYNGNEDINSKNYTDVIKVSKKSNITVDNISELFLVQIPSVSSAIANAIMIKFKTFTNLINNLQNDTNCLDDICITIKNGKTRSINKTTKHNIFKYILQKNDTIIVNTNK